MDGVISDGSNQRPHFSLRTLCRALSFTRDVTPHYGFKRSLYDGFSMSFLTMLNVPSHLMMERMIRQKILGVYVFNGLYRRVFVEPCKTYQSTEPKS